MVDRELELPVRVTDFHAWWPKIRLGLERVAEGSGDTWMPEDVYAALSTGQASLYATETAFAVVQIIPQFDGLALLLWAVYARPGDWASRIGWVKDLARSAGCKRIIFHSARRGWERRAKDLGFVRRSVTYAMEL